MSFSGSSEDRLEIRDLIDAYADAVTRNDSAGWAATWADDGEWSIPDGTGGTLTARGRDAIVELWRKAMKKFPDVIFQAWPGAIAVEGTRAAVRCYTSEIYASETGSSTIRGAYEDECVKVDGRWLFRRRAFVALASNRS